MSERPQAGTDTIAKFSDSGDVHFVLGRLIRGVVHEALNPLNSILMTTELAHACIGNDEELADCLHTIAGAARDSGEWLRELGELALADDFQPQRRTAVGQMLSRARGLLGSRLTRSGCTLNIAMGNQSMRRPLQTMACAAAIAILIDQLIENQATRIELTVCEEPALALVIATNAMLGNNAEAQVAERFARRVCKDHGGEYLVNEGVLKLRLSPEEPA